MVKCLVKRAADDASWGHHQRPPTGERETRGNSECGFPGADGHNAGGARSTASVVVGERTKRFRLASAQCVPVDLVPHSVEVGRHHPWTPLKCRRRGKTSERVGLHGRALDHGVVDDEAGETFIKS
jgi:hypothetical protein